MDRPNIILITTDQQRFDTICALGNQHIHTPHLNWLVDDGICFTRCYADCPICIPSRATIMTGRAGYATGLEANTDAVKPMRDNPTLPGLLTAAGYQTRAQGKMHFEPMRCNYGFEHMELPEAYYRACAKNRELGMPKDHGVGENEVEPVISTVHESRSLTRWTVERSIEFIETRDDTRPFFLWTSFTKPHPPFDPCANYWALYQNAPVPEPFYGDWSRELVDVPAGLMQSTFMLNNVWRMSARQIEDMRRAYYACITQVDYSLGLLFASLREKNLLENTWIVFTSDHGDMLGDHHMGAKSVFFEGSAHIPLLVRPASRAWQRHPLAGRRVDSLTTLGDIMPTVLALAGVDCPAGLDGVNLLSLAENPHEREFFGAVKDSCYAIIDGDYKYLWCRQGGAELLFNLRDDPHELCNLAGCGEEEERLTRLRGRLLERMRRHHPELLEGAWLGTAPALPPQQVNRWPGFHSALYPCDVLH